MRGTWKRTFRPAFVICSLFVFLLLRISRQVPFDGIHSWRFLKYRLIEQTRNLEEDALVNDLAFHSIERMETVLLPRHLLVSKHGASSVSNISGNLSKQSVENDGSSIDSAQVAGTSICQDVRKHIGYPDSCAYVQASPQCRSGTLIEYIQVFFCVFAGAPVLGYVAVAVWLGALFYTLGNTAADFFCCSLEKLSKLLRLPPTVAGVTLLPLGNGAPDVFASIAAFVGASGQGQVGLNSVLGGAVFVTSIVAGSVSLAVVASQAAGGSVVTLDRKCFFRDVGFFLVSVMALGIMLYIGKVHLWGAAAYLSIYVAYAVTVAAVELLRSRRNKFRTWHALEPLLPGVDREANHYQHNLVSDDSLDPSGGPFLDLLGRNSTVNAVETSLPQWMWAPHVAIYSRQSSNDSVASRPLWGWSEIEQEQVLWYTPRGLCFYLIEWPLTLPRRLTIPVVEHVRWSRPFAIISATLAPVLLAMVWDGHDSEPFGSSQKVYIVAGLVGTMFGFLSFLKLNNENPPRRYLFPWVAGGFIMSIVWFYIIANELVGVLVALGVILEIDPAILGLTVLAWGNSIGDLMSNLALACHGGDGVQIAFSGCYAGPMFNTLVGIGLSLVLASWKTYPVSFTIPQDDSIFYTLAFLVAGLLWALLVLPAGRMHPSKVFGIGLLCLYGTFLIFRLSRSLGFVSVVGSS